MVHNNGVYMVLKGKGRILPHVRGGVYIYVSKEVANDSVFPFKEPEDVVVEIKKKELLIKKA